MLLKGIHRYSRLTGNWLVEIGAHDVNAFSLERLVHSPQGIIGHIHDSQIASLLKALDIPVVNVSGVIPSQLPFPSVIMDHERIGEFAAEKLLELGLHHLAIPSSPEVIPYEFYTQRLSGFIRKVEEHPEITLHCLDYGVETPDRFFPPKSEKGQSITLEELPKPCGIFAPSDREALSLNQDCLFKGIRVPEEVSILGTGNLEPLCEFAHPSLSSIATAMEQVGFLAAKAMDLLLHDGSPASLTQLSGPLRLVTRGSTSQVMVEDPLVREALTFIRDEVRNGINVADVVRHCSGTRRALEIRFRKATGVSILERIHRLRLEHASELLLDTQESIPHIAKLCGYSNPEHMSRAFRRYLDILPREFRQRARV